VSSTSDEEFLEYTEYYPVPLDEDASWDLGELHVDAELEMPVLRRIYEDNEDDDLVLARIAPDYVEILWTAAQVAATSLALGGYVTSAARKWRDKRLKLPEGTRLTLTLTPAKQDDRRGHTRIVISDIHTKTPDEITNEIRQTLLRYTGVPRRIVVARRRVVPRRMVDGTQSPEESSS